MVMKKFGFITTMLGMLAMSACGPTSNDPLKDYKDLNGVPVGTAGANTTKVEYRYIEKNVTVIQGIDQDDPRGSDSIGQTILQNAIFRVEVPENIDFIQGKEGSFEFSIKILKGKATFEVDEKSFPADAKLEALDDGKFKLTWTPQNSIKSGLDFDGVFQVALKNVKFEKSEDQKAYDTLMLKTRAVPFIVRKNTKIPALKVVGLDGDRALNATQKFTVEVTPPAGYKGEPIAPIIFYDEGQILGTDGLVENNGGYFIDIDPANTSAEVKADGTFVFHYVFDTRPTNERPMLEQYDKTGKVVSDATKLNVRVSFRTDSETVAASDITTLKFKINLK
jgi:hypothetical protein